MKFKSAAHDGNEAGIRKILRSYSIVPDNLEINGKKWKLDSEHQTMKEALASAQYIQRYKIFKYANGYALYEQNYF